MRERKQVREGEKKEKGMRKRRLGGRRYSWIHK